MPHYDTLDEERQISQPQVSHPGDGEWTEVISAQTNLLDLKLNEVWQYRDLIRIFVRRDFVSAYKQTVLGPVWHFVTPIFGGLINVVLFNSIAGIPTDGAPPILFQMLSLAIWNYFTQCFNGASNTFRANAGIFSKVYFPRLTVPISRSISALFQLGIRFIVIIGLWVYFFNKGALELPGLDLLWFPVLLLMLSVLGISLGVIASSLTVKYKDMSNFIGYAMQFLMYVSAVVYPISIIPANYRFLVDYNPLVPVLEAFRNIILNVGTFDTVGLLTAAGVTLAVFFPSVIIFNYTERTFIDKV